MISLAIRLFHFLAASLTFVLFQMFETFVLYGGVIWELAFQESLGREHLAGTTKSPNGPNYPSDPCSPLPVFVYRMASNF